MPRVTRRKAILFALVFAAVAAGALTWVALETSFGQRELAECRAWWRTMWGMPMFRIFAGFVSLCGAAFFLDLLFIAFEPRAGARAECLPGSDEAAEPSIPRGSRRKKALVALSVFLALGLLVVWIVLENPFGRQEIAGYRVWWQTMWNSGVVHLMGGMMIFGGLAVLGGFGSSRSSPHRRRKKGGPIGGFHSTEAMILGEHYENPWKRWAARKVRDMFF